MISSIPDKEEVLPVPENPAFGQLQAAVNRYCLHLTGSRWDAEDLAQDTWLKAINTLTHSGHANTEAFLLRIAKNTWIDRSRRKKMLTDILQKWVPEVTLPDHGTEEIDAVFAVLGEYMSPLQRAAFLLRDILDYTGEEAAAILQTTEGALKAALHRARQALPAIREALLKGKTPHPSDEGLKTFLRCLAAAYHSGDVAAMVALVQQDVLEPVTAISIAQSRVIRKRYASSRPESSPTALLAA